MLNLSHSYAICKLPKTSAKEGTLLKKPQEKLQFKLKSFESL